ncbi:hypothetical protein SAY87_007683 [Trapa incisa]|uniref:Uncharacterized protein n=1 Tax=Trapa incisa TaxID=236973 RepID=A0AAN7KKU2_9MYRT|nr:hypothetical protein SAY87_007683 [Trapa incisa]
MSELSSISLYTRRLVEVVKQRPKWKPHGIFKDIHPNKPYLHQLSCSWGAVFFPKQWREFYVYMNMRFTEDAKANPVQIPKSRTNGLAGVMEEVSHRHDVPQGLSQPLPELPQPGQLLHQPHGARGSYQL